MIKRFLLLGVLFGSTSAFAADLVAIYKQALTSDPIFQQAIAQRLVTKENVPINLAAYLPSLSFQAVPSVTKTNIYGKLNGFPKVNTDQAYQITLQASQTVFDMAQLNAIQSARSLSSGADATLNAALQNLMIRVSSAYFAILKDEDNLDYTEATKIAYAEQLDQVKQQYEVGLKTITDVYTAQAAYDTASAAYIAAQNTLDNDRENLRVITGVYYPRLSYLREDFPLISPDPANVDQWVKTSQMQNWNIKAAQYAVDAALSVVKQQNAGHLPTVTFSGQMNRQYNKNINDSVGDTLDITGVSVAYNRSIQFNINVPLFSGGGVVAQTNQAVYSYNVSRQQLEQTLRNTINTTRQSYLGIMSGISQIKADLQAIKSSISSLEGMEASYLVGTETLVNVLNQQQRVFQNQTAYATDRYNYINSILTLKASAGTLSFKDLCAVNAWLVDKDRPKVRKTRLRYSSSDQYSKAKTKEPAKA